MQKVDYLHFYSKIMRKLQPCWNVYGHLLGSVYKQTIDFWLKNLKSQEHVHQ